MAELKADWVVNAAAYTAVDSRGGSAGRAERSTTPRLAIHSGRRGARGARLLHLSTDFVFDGDIRRAYLPADANQSVERLRRKQAAGERHVIAGRSGIVLRTSWVYAAAGKNFVLTMLD